MKIIVEVQKEEFDTQKINEKLQKENFNVGASVCFTGICRGENDRIKSLELEHYPDMAKKQLETIAKQAGEKWNLLAIAIVHRYGTIMAGEKIVMVTVLSEHRKEAFEAAQFAMDFLKTEAPFWKKENSRDGSEWVS